MPTQRVASKSIVSFLREISQHVDDNGIETVATVPMGLNEQSENTICWCKKKSVPTPLSCAVLIAGVDFTSTSSETCIIKAQNPKYSFTKVVMQFFTPPTVIGGIHPTAQISDAFMIDPTASIGANSVLIGTGSIGENTIIHPNVTIKGPISIGNNVEIHPGCVLGYDGFGYSKTNNGEYEKFPHLRGIIIEDWVEIGATSCIDRGILTDTVVRAHTKIDKACLIAHGATIGRSCMIAGFSNIGGSVAVGERVWISPKSTILNGITIEDDSFIGIGSVVLRSVKNGTTVFGNPAQVIKKRLDSPT